MALAVSTTMTVGAASAVSCNILGRVQRSLGGSNYLTVLVRPEDVASFEVVGDPIAITLSVGGSSIVLGGYELMDRRVSERGVNALGNVVPQQEAWTLRSNLEALRRGRSGLVTVGTANPLTREGTVDESATNYRDNRQLADILLDAMGLTHEPAPASMNSALGVTLPPPAPLDWGNASALQELESLLSRTGHALNVKSNGTIEIIRLARAGETLSIPSNIAEVIEVDDRRTAPGVRAQKILVHSGPTRTIRISRLELGAGLEWVALDPTQGVFVNQTDWGLTTAGPEDIATLRLGPKNPDLEPGEWARIFTALRITDERRRRIVAFANAAALGGDLASSTFANHGAVVVLTAGAQASALGTLAAYPASGEHRLDDIQVDPSRGVIVLTNNENRVYAKLGDGFASWSGLEALEGQTTEDDGQGGQTVTPGEIYAIVAHESDELDESDNSDWLSNYYQATFEVSGETITKVDQEDNWKDDPSVVKVAAPFLQEIVLDASVASGGADESVNGAALDTLARTIAAARAADASVQRGTIQLRGFQSIEPGSLGGFVSSVSYDVQSFRTVLQVAEHETPEGFYEAQERGARRSMTAGLSRFSLPGSSVGESDVQNAGASDRGRLALQGGQVGASTLAKRGAEARAAVPDAVRSVALRENAGRHEPALMLGKLTASTSIITDRGWLYDFEEVQLSGTDDAPTFETVTGGITGKAVNIAEANNPASGVIAAGIDTANLPGTYELQPIRSGTAGMIVALMGPISWVDSAESPPEQGPLWLMLGGVANDVDGGCEE